MSGKRLAVEVLIDLRRRLDPLPSRSRERRDIVRQAADLYGISESTLYRQLERLYRPKALRRADQGVPRVLPKAQMMRYCEVIAALKIRTRNKKGRYISTLRAIEVLEGQGVETPDGLVNPEKGQLRKATVNRYLKQWGFDHRTLTYQAPAVRFQARHSNECWQFDLSPSDLKHVAEPLCDTLTGLALRRKKYTFYDICFDVSFLMSQYGVRATSLKKRDTKGSPHVTHRIRPR